MTGLAVPAADVERWAGLLGRQVAAADAPVAAEQIIGGYRQSPFLQQVVDHALAAGYVKVKAGKLLPGPVKPPPFRHRGTPKPRKRPKTTEADRRAQAEANRKAAEERIAAAVVAVERVVAEGPWPVPIKSLPGQIGHQAGATKKAIRRLEDEARVHRQSYGQRAGLWRTREEYEAAGQ